MNDEEDEIKDWLLAQEAPLYVEPDKTDPYTRLSHFIGDDRAGVVIDYHVFPDLSVQLHAVTMPDYSTFGLMRVPESDALERARQLVDAALNWAAENGRGPQEAPAAWRTSQQEGNQLIDAIGRELDPGYDDRKRRENAEGIVEALLEEQPVRVVHCRNGSIYVRAARDGGYYVTASGQRIQRVRPEDLPYVLDVMTRTLGGRRTSGGS